MPLLVEEQEQFLQVLEGTEARVVYKEEEVKHGYRLTVQAGGMAFQKDYRNNEDVDREMLEEMRNALANVHAVRVGNYVEIEALFK